MKLKKDYIIYLMNGMTQKELSQKMEITDTWLSTIFKRGHASMNIVNKLAKALNVETIEIIKMED